MNILIAIAIPFLLLSLAWCVFIVYRNEWVYGQRIDWNKRSHEYIRWCIYHDEAAYWAFSDRITKTLLGYNSMLYRRFWHFDIESFVVDHECYRAVQDFHSKQTPSDDDYLSHQSLIRECASH